MAADPCQIVDALAAFQLDVLKRINRKFAALRSLAQLIEQLGDLSTLIPNISKLIPIIQIDLAMYQRLAASCPFLNLPQVSTGDVNQLQAMVAGAYANFFNKLLRHPWNRLGLLQSYMDNFQSQINGAFAQAGDFFACLQAVCAAGKAVAGQLNAIADADIGKEIKTFANNFAANAGQVLTEGMKQKYAQIVEAKDQLKALGADVKTDYATAKAELAKASVTTTTTASTSSSATATTFNSDNNF